MVNTGLLVLTHPTKVKTLLPLIRKHVLKTLYVQCFPEENIISMPENYTTTNSPWKWPSCAKIIANIYTTTATISPQLDVRVLLTTMKKPNLCIINTKKPIEIVIFDRIYIKKQADTFIQDYLANTSMDCKFITCDDNADEESHDEILEAKETKAFKSVVLGGTFDRLHNGHKIFLSEAIAQCTEKLTVGVTDENMIKGKLLPELIQPCAKRIASVTDFLEDVDPSLTYNVVPISDMYGPTKFDPAFEMIVVSAETRRGGDKINEYRIKHGLSELSIHVVNLVLDDNHQIHEEHKISSSNQRIRLLGTKIVFPNLKDRALKPYIIGLTGGIASGKSSIAQKLEKLGAGHVDCDKLAHNSYVPGNKCYQLIVEHFGPNVLKTDGSIDRKALGDIVFKNEKELHKLNALLWPVIWEDAKREISILNEKGYHVIVLEAAVLIQANWMHECHEIWTCILPEDEAVKRLRKRNGLSEEEAKIRIKAQPSNSKQVSHANVVFCTLWSYDFTEKQVKTAWEELTLNLSQRENS